MHYLLLGWVWKKLEIWLYGHTVPSTEDTIILLIFCTMLSNSYKRESLKKGEEHD